MNLEQILMGVQANVDRSNDPIEWDDEDTVVRVGLINRGIRTWAGDNNTRWDELISVAEVGTAKAGKNTFSLDDDYRLLEACYTDDGQALPVKTLQESTRAGRYVYVSGNAADGYELNFGWDVSESDGIVGRKIRVYAYRKPVELVKPKDVPEMSEPDYLIAFVSAELMIDDDTTQYSKYANDAAVILANMRDRNDQLAQNQCRDALEDYVGLGE